ncbi:hypothetical protein [Scytonema sp. NUACC26]|uniref:hypothetical protein n=1 Tax=Scytonema sp. NUACC26 TaxID=3140176 RepID=UPI0038B30874
MSFTDHKHCNAFSLFAIILDESYDYYLVANNPGSVAVNPGFAAVLVANNPGLKKSGSAGLSD